MARYEAYVAGILSQRFPGVRIHSDVRVTGSKSSLLRQIDVLVEAEGIIAVDCKCYIRKVDVKHVESFLGMLDDLNVRVGLMVTTKGYTSGAIARAKSDPKIDLQIISPDRLSYYQRVAAPLVWRGSLGIWLETPPGWVMDDEWYRTRGAPLVAMYPLGHTLESATRSAAISYADILFKPTKVTPISEIAAPHQADILADHPESTFTFETFALSDQRGESREALLRTATIGARPFGQEHCLYLDYGEAVLLLALNSPPGEADRLVPKLLEMARTSFVMTIVDGRNEQ